MEELKMSEYRRKKIIEWMKEAENTMQKDLPINDSAREIYNFFNEGIDRRGFDEKPLSERDIMFAAEDRKHMQVVTVLGTDTIKGEEYIKVCSPTGLICNLKPEMVRRLNGIKRLIIPNYIACDKPNKDQDLDGEMFLATINAQDHVTGETHNVMASVRYDYLRTTEEENYTVNTIYQDWGPLVQGQTIRPEYVNVLGKIKSNW